MGAANLLARAGHQVTVLEKNEDLGGRAGFFEAEGFRFDTGPTWYLMPEVFTRYFKLLGLKVENYLKLHRLSPTYRVYFEGRKEPVDLYSSLEKDRYTAESFEIGGADKLEKYLAKAAGRYEIMAEHFFYRDFRKFKDLFNRGTWPALKNIPLFGSVNKQVKRFFKSEEMQKILQYNTVFLGTSPYTAPALYSMMSQVDLGQGAYYPEGGIRSLILAFRKIGETFGVEYHTGAEVRKIIVEGNTAKGVELAGGKQIAAEVILSNADIYHTETALLTGKHRSYTKKFWQTRTLAPSAFLLFLGVKGKLPNLRHHTLYFTRDWQQNFKEIFDQPCWPKNPSLYLCVPSRTDASMAPEGCESIFVLVPVAPGLVESTRQCREYRNFIIDQLEKGLGIENLRSMIKYEKVIKPSDFEKRYNSQNGTALGLAHTLGQTAMFRPKNKSKKVKNLYYAGSGTHPGIGLPVCLISAELAARRIMKEQI